MADSEKPTTPFTPPIQDVAPRLGVPLTAEQVVMQQQAMQQAEGGGGPFIDPSITDPAAAAYAAGAAARRASLPKYTTQVSDGPGPAIPPLEQPHQDGMTMAQQAAAYARASSQQQAGALAQQPRAPGSIIEGGGVAVGSMAPGAKRTMPSAQQMGIMPGDLLPPEAQQDPGFRQGQGSMIAQSQPDMALKYGVVRGHQRIPAQALQANIGGGPQMGAPGDPALRRPVSQTINDLQALSTVQAAQKSQPAGFPRTAEEAEQQASAGPSAASAHIGEPPKKNEPSDADKEVEKARFKEVIRDMDDFDFDQLRRTMNDDNIRNPEQRKIIEARLSPLNVDELILRNRVRQKIPILPGKFEPTFMSMTGDDELAIKRLLMKESSSVEVTDQYLLTKWGFMSMTVGLYAINNNVIPTHLDKEDNFDDKLFWTKFRWVMKRPLHMCASLGANHAWFEIRVRKLFTAEIVGNG